MKEIDEKKYYIYRWFVKDTNQTFYIGKGSGNRLKAKNGRSEAFNQIINDNACDVEKIFENLTEEEAYQKEYETICWYKKNEPDILTNIADGGRGTRGVVASDETKQKISVASKKMWSDPQFYQKQVNRLRDPNGIWKSDEFRKKISEIVSGEKNPNYGNHWSDAQKEHLSKLKIETGMSKGTRNGRATPIICLETGEVFDYIELAMEKYGVPNSGSFSVVFRDETRTASGLHWKKYDEKYLDDTYRWVELVRILSKTERCKGFVCIETKEIIPSKRELTKKYNLSDRKLEKQLKNFNSVSINDLTFYPVTRYYSEIILNSEA